MTMVGVGMSACLVFFGLEVEAVGLHGLYDDFHRVEQICKDGDLGG